MPEPVSNADLKRVARELGVEPAALAHLALDLFGAWVSGQQRFPTLSQQNQQWYRTILERAGKVNPSRDELKAWFGMPHGTAQYLAGVFYDSSAEADDAALLDEIRKQIVKAVRDAGNKGKLGSAEVTAWLKPKAGRALEARVIEALSLQPTEPPTITKLAGVVKVTFSKNKGFDVLCEALGETATEELKEAAGL